VSNVYNWSTTPNPSCATLEPQPPDMPFCMSDAQDSLGTDCTGVPGLSNSFGTLIMSTSYEVTRDYPQGVTWNATAELFVNIGNNTHLVDRNLFVPLCTINKVDMESTVLAFPWFGEVQELGGDGPSIGMLYQEGNSYIETNSTWKATMAETTTVRVCPSAMIFLLLHSRPDEVGCQCCCELPLRIC